MDTYDFLNPLCWYTLVGRIVGTLVDEDYDNLKINKKRRSCIDLDIHNSKVFSSEMGTFEWDILNPDRIINLGIKNEWRTSNI